MSPPRAKQALEKMGSPPSLEKNEDDQIKLRVIFQPFKELYEFHHFNNQAQYEAVKSIMPLFEGAKIFLVRHLHANPSADLMKKRERLIRLKHDLSKIEIRHLDQPPLFKVDTFFKVDTLTGVNITNKTRQLIKIYTGTANN